MFTLDIRGDAEAARLRKSGVLPSPFRRTGQVYVERRHLRAIRLLYERARYAARTTTPQQYNARLHCRGRLSPRFSLQAAFRHYACSAYQSEMRT